MTSYLGLSSRHNRYVCLEDLKKFALKLYPDDENLAAWIIKTLLRDSKFYKLVFPGVEATGREYELDVRHRVTMKSRDDWAVEIMSRGHMHRWSELQEPELWLIGVDSLKEQYHKLYVHDPYWQCTDGVLHTSYMYTPSAQEADRLIAELTASIDYETWDQQAKTQDINPCVFSVIRWWVLTL